VLFEHIYLLIGLLLILDILKKPRILRIHSFCLTMAKESWKYLNNETKIQINRIANYFSPDLVKEKGDSEKGSVSFTTKADADEIWGSEGKIEINWEKMAPYDYHQGLRVKESIRMYGSINVIASKKENRWHLAHEITIWWGNRQQVMRKRFYASKIVHGIFFCEHTQRVFEIHAVSLGSHFHIYERFFMEIIESLQCHGS
jgi:hypothetical protein